MKCFANWGTEHEDVATCWTGAHIDSELDTEDSELFWIIRFRRFGIILDQGFSIRYYQV